MFVVVLKFSDNRGKAGQHMEGHKTWLKHGFDEGVFLLAGSLHFNAGGAILAHGETLAALRERVNADPFVAEGIVTVEILEIMPSKTEPRFDFLLP